MSPQLKPGQALRLVVQALGGRISIPLSLVRSQVANFSDKVALDVEPVSPGLQVSGRAEALGAPIAFSARIDAEGVHVEGQQRTVTIRLSEVTLSTDEDAPGPLADAIRNGMIDTQNPATLIGNMMPLPDLVVRAEGQEVVIDLMRVPAIAADARLQTAFAAVTSVLCVSSVQISGDAIVLGLGVLPGGPKEAALSTARAALFPAVRYLWPEGQP